jgi:hypothetical protein
VTYTLQFLNSQSETSIFHNHFFSHFRVYFEEVEAWPHRGVMATEILENDCGKFKFSSKIKISKAGR